jgi:hypothetical protein
MTNSAERKKSLNFDSVRKYHYISDRDGLWAAFKNRYGLRYYEGNKLKAENLEKIRAGKQDDCI